jgi:hypothetical protein
MQRNQNRAEHVAENWSLHHPRRPPMSSLFQGEFDSPQVPVQPQSIGLTADSGYGLYVERQKVSSRVLPVETPVPLV